MTGDHWHQVVNADAHVISYIYAGTTVVSTCGANPNECYRKKVYLTINPLSIQYRLNTTVTDYNSGTVIAYVAEVGNSGLPDCNIE